MNDTNSYSNYLEEECIDEDYQYDERQEDEGFDEDCILTPKKEVPQHITQDTTDYANERSETPYDNEDWEVEEGDEY